MAGISDQEMTSHSSGNCASSDAESSDAADSTGSHPSAK